MTDKLNLDAETYFAIVPEWVVFCGNPRAVQVYAILARHANTEGAAWPGRKRIAALADCSPDTVDRTLDVLVEMGAVSRHRRQKDDGSYETNLYRIYFSPPAAGWKAKEGGVVASVRLPVRGGAEGGGRTGAELTRTTSNQTQEPNTPTPSAENPYWDALEKVFGYRPADSSSERSLWGAIVKMVKELGDPPTEIERRAALWLVGGVWGDRSDPPRLTPGALRKHYQWLGSRLAEASEADLAEWRRAYKREQRRQQLAQQGGNENDDSGSAA